MTVDMVLKTRKIFVNRRSILLGGATVAATSAFGAGGPMQVAQAQQFSASDGKNPNILFILADNVGYGVPSSYNGGILDTPTPRIDELAAEGGSAACPRVLAGAWQYRFAADARSGPI